jgi:hypothetical protein
MMSSTCSRRDVPAPSSDAVPAGGTCRARALGAAGLAAAPRGPVSGWLLDTDCKAGSGAAQW